MISLSSDQSHRFVDPRILNQIVRRIVAVFRRFDA